MEAVIAKGMLFALPHGLGVIEVAVVMNCLGHIAGFA